MLATDDRGTWFPTPVSLSLLRQVLNVGIGWMSGQVRLTATAHSFHGALSPPCDPGGSTEGARTGGAGALPRSLSSCGD